MKCSWPVRRSIQAERNKCESKREKKISSTPATVFFTDFDIANASLGQCVLLISWIYFDKWNKFDPLLLYSESQCIRCCRLSLQCIDPICSCLFNLLEKRMSKPCTRCKQATAQDKAIHEPDRRIAHTQRIKLKFQELFVSFFFFLFACSNIMLLYFVWFVVVIFVQDIYYGYIPNTTNWISRPFSM